MKADTPIQKTLSALGICAKARALVIGTPMVCESLRGAKKPLAVLAACDNSENTAKKLSDKCTYWGVPLSVIDADGDTLAAAIGKQSRVAAVAITDENLYRLVRGTLQNKTEA